MSTMLLKVVCCVMLTATELYGSNLGSMFFSHDQLVKRSIGLKREKRQADYCVEDCVKDKDENFDIHLPNGMEVPISSHVDPVLFSFSLTQDKFSKLCNNVYKPYAQCLNKCPDTEELQATIAVNTKSEYACKTKYNEIYNAIPCVQSVVDDMQSNCVYSGNCRKLKNAPLLYLSALVSNKTQNYDQMRKLRENNCKFVKCEGDCAFPMLQQKCGPAVTVLLKNYGNIHFSGQKKLFEVLDSLDEWPDSCNFSFN